MNIDKFLSRTKRNAAQLASELELNPSSITAWKKGKATPAYDVCQRLLELGMDIDELFTPELWESILSRHAEDMRDQVVLTPEDCATIVRNGLQSLCDKGQNTVVPSER